MSPHNGLLRRHQPDAEQLNYFEIQRLHKVQASVTTGAHDEDCDVFTRRRRNLHTEQHSP